MARKIAFTVACPLYGRRAENALASFKLHNPSFDTRWFKEEDLVSYTEAKNQWHWAMPGGLEATLRLLEEGYDEIWFVGADTQTYAPITGCFPPGYSMVITPHILKPLPNDGKAPSLTQIRLMGIYNSGVWALRAGAKPFIEWWLTQTLALGGMNPEKGVSADQGWLEYAPCFMDDVYISRDPGLNMAYWRMGDHKVQISTLGNVAQAWTVDTHLLKIFHFSGLTKETNIDKMSKYQSRIVCPDPARELFEDYKKVAFE